MDISSHLRISFATDFPRPVCRCASIYNFWPGSILFLICVRDKILINQSTEMGEYQLTCQLFHFTKILKKSKRKSFFSKYYQLLFEC